MNIHDWESLQEWWTAVYTLLCNDSRNICLAKCMSSKVPGTSTLVCKIWLVIFGRFTSFWRTSCNQWHTLMHLKCPQTPTFRQPNHVHSGNDTWWGFYGYYKLKFCQQPFSMVLENSPPKKNVSKGLYLTWYLQQLTPSSAWGLLDILIKNIAKSLWISLSVCNTGAYNTNKCLNIAKYFLVMVSKWFNSILRVRITNCVIQSNYSRNIPMGMKIWMACRIIIKIFVTNGLNSFCEISYFVSILINVWYSQIYLWIQHKFFLEW